MSNINNSNSNSASKGTNPTFQQQKGISLLNQSNPIQINPNLQSPKQVQYPLPPLYKQCLTDRAVSPPPQFVQNKINIVGSGASSNLNKPLVLPHQLATSPKPSIGILQLQKKNDVTLDSKDQKEQNNISTANKAQGTYQVVSVTSRNISPQLESSRQQRFYSPTPVSVREGTGTTEYQQNNNKLSNQVTALYFSNNTQATQQVFMPQQQQLAQQYQPYYPLNAPSGSNSKLTTLNSDRSQQGQTQISVLQAKPLGEKQIFQNQQQAQRLVSPPHMINPVLKPQINLSPSSQVAMQNIQKSPNLHIRSQTAIQQATNLIQNNNLSPTKNIISIIPSTNAYNPSRSVENNNLNNASISSLQKYNIGENLTGSQNQQAQQQISQDLARSNNAKIIQVNNQSKGYIISNLLHSQASPIKQVIKVNNNQPLQEQNVQQQQQQSNLQNINSTHLSPEAKKLYEMIGKYNSVVNDAQPQQNNENKINNSSAQSQIIQAPNSNQIVARSQSPNERIAFKQKEVQVIQPATTQIIYPSIQTRVIPAQLIATNAAPVSFIPKRSFVEVQKAIPSPASHSLDEKRKSSSVHKSIHSSRSVSVDENRNDLSIIIEVNSATKNRRFIEGSPVRSKSPGVVQGTQALIQNSPAIRRTHYYKKGNRTLTLEEVMEEKKKASTQQQAQSQFIQSQQTSNVKFDNISPLKYDKIEEERDEVLQPEEYTTNEGQYHQGLLKNNLYSTESNNPYQTSNTNSAYNTDYQSSNIQKPLTKEQIEFDREQNIIKQQQELLLKQQRETLEQQKILIQQAESKSSSDQYESLLKESQLRESQLKEQLERQQREQMQRMKQQQEEFQRNFLIEQERRSSNDSQFLKESQVKEYELREQLERKQQEYLFKIQMEQIEFQKNLMQQQAEQKSFMESQILKESQVKEQKLQEQLERQQLEVQQQQLKFQEEKLRLEREQQELQRNLQNQAKELEKVKLQIEQDKKKEMEEQLKRQSNEQQKQFDMLSKQQDNIIRREQEIQQQKELEQQKQIEQQQQQFQQMLLAQQQTSAEERKQFKEIYNTQQEELKNLQKQQMNQQQAFAEQLSQIIKQHNQQLENLKKEQDLQTRELKEMLLDQSRNQGNPPNENQLFYDKLREEKEQLMKQQMEQALQLERQKQELKEKEYQMMQEQQQLLFQQQAQQIELLKKKQQEQEEMQRSLFEQKQQLENQFNEFRSRNESSQMNSYEAATSDRVDIQNNRRDRREVEVERAIQISKDNFKDHDDDEEEDQQEDKGLQQIHFNETIKQNKESSQQLQPQQTQQTGRFFRNFYLISQLISFLFFKIFQRTINQLILFINYSSTIQNKN